MSVLSACSLFTWLYSPIVYGITAHAAFTASGWMPTRLPVPPCGIVNWQGLSPRNSTSASRAPPSAPANRHSEEKTGQRSDPQAESEQYSFLPLKAVIELHEYELDGFDPQQQLSVLNAALAKVVRATTYRALEASALAYLPTEQLRAIANCIDAVKWWYLALPRQAREPVARLIAQTRADGRV